MRFPSVADVARELRLINANVEAGCDDPHHEQPCGCAGCDVRLCVWGDGTWCVRWGLVDYDQSHSDYCGASSVPGCGGRDCQPRRFNSRDVARDLIEQCKEQRAIGGES